MAKNNSEAKIKFTAETGGFNKAINKAESELKVLRAELKLNETQMKNTGESVEGLENSQKLLSSQLENAQSKTEALRGKLDKAIEIYGEGSNVVANYKRAVANAQIEEEKISKKIADVTQKLEQQKSAAENMATASDKLTDKMNAQQTELTQLKKKYADLVIEGKETSDEAQKLAREISDLSGELKESKTAFSEASKKADDLDNSLDNAGDAAENSGDGFTIAKGAVSDLASEAIQAAIGKVSEFVGWLKELPEATREIRQDMATLDTSFEKQGFTVEQAQTTWQGLYRIFGEDDRAVEAANLIAKMSKNQEDLNTWVTITQGVWGTYQDSLPVESLAESSNETAKVGQVTGTLADALNWSSEAASMFSKYMSEDVTTAEDAFNEALKECTTEEERQALITETLTALYGNAAKEYEKASGAQLDAKDATAENILAQNDLATAIEPVTTEWENMKTSLMQGIMPAIEAVSGAMLDAMAWMKEHPVLMKVIAAVVGVLAAAITALTVVVVAWTVAQWALNSAILANPITWIIVGIVAAIAAVVAIIILVIEYWDKIVEAVKNCVKWICDAWNGFVTWIDTNVIQPVVNFFKGLWDGIVNIFKSIIDWVKNNWKSIVLFFINPFGAVFNYLYENFEGFRNFINNIVTAIKNFFVDMWNGIKQVWDWICNAVQVAIMFIGSIISAAFDIITLPFRFIWENCKEYVFAAWEWIKNAVSTAINKVKSVITTVFNAVKNFFSTVWNGIKNIFTTVWGAIVNFLTPILNKIKSVITNVFNKVKSTISTIFNGVKNVVTTVWNAIKNAITTAVNNIKNNVTKVFNAVKTVVTTVFNGIKSVATTVWNAIKNTISNVVNGVKSKVSSVFNAVKSTVSNVFTGIKSTATRVWNGIKNAITTPIEAAKNKVKSIIDTIKGFFSKLKLKLPKIKLPHFKITGKLSLSPPSVPKLKIDWYKNGGIMTRPTIFGASGNTLLGGGEAGAEAILPISKLEDYIVGAIEKTASVVNFDILAAAIEDLANRPIKMNINGREFALATAGDTDSVGGLRNSFKSRGLIVE